MGDVVNAVLSPVKSVIGGVSKALGFGGTQSQQTSSSKQLSSFAQFPDLQKAIAEFGFGNVQNIAPQLPQRIGGFQFQPLNAQGLFPQQQSAFEQAVRQATSQISGNYAGHGMLLPQHIGAIAGSAAQQVMPQFAPLIGQQVTNAGVLPEQVTQNQINQLLQLISTYPGLLGGAGTVISQGTSNFPTMLQSILPAFAQGAGQGGFSKGGAFTF